jgi:antitoxin CptB
MVSTYMPPMPSDAEIKRLHWRAHHRGTKEADLLIGGYFDRHSAQWDDAQMEWFETLLQEEDVDIMAWAIGTARAPERFAGPMLEALKRLDYIPVAK